MNAIVCDPKAKKSAWDICIDLKNNGLLAKPTHDHIIRMAPPLTISEKEMVQAIEIIAKVFKA
jgi:ornithine--oxo-acid transaminase